MIFEKLKNSDYSELVPMIAQVAIFWSGEFLYAVLFGFGIKTGMEIYNFIFY